VAVRVRPDLPPSEAVDHAVEERFLSRGEAARYLGVPVGTLYQWARTGRIPCVVTLGGHLRFSTRDLDAYQARRTRVARQFGQRV
jgi:excisionase family DNA binding protein